VEAVVESVKLYAELIATSVTRLRVLANPMVRLVFLRQIYFTAVQSLRLLSIVALVVGATFVGQFTSILGADSNVYELVELVLVRHVAPLAASMIVIGRSATAISTELALMRCTGEIEALRGMRIPVHDYLIVPRVAAVTLATMGCCFYFQLIAVIGGFALSSIMLDVTLEDQLHRFALHVSLPLMALELLKSLCFGFFIAAIACATGLNVPPRMTEVPRVPARAFLRSLVAVLAIDAAFLLATLRFAEATQGGSRYFGL
jgi:phospholipid/cholesterol/gamma-HCH transport system permease protein